MIMRIGNGWIQPRDRLRRAGIPSTTRKDWRVTDARRDLSSATTKSCQERQTTHFRMLGRGVCSPIGRASCRSDEMNDCAADLTHLQALVFEIEQLLYLEASLL